jgi:vacuolar-type H+-ATPase catalytic subunit A/Vma1
VSNLNRLGKWRVLLTGWQLGTRPKGDPEGDAVRDHREATLMLRVEVTALTALLVEKGVFTADEFCVAIEAEAGKLNADLERRWPGVRATDDGLVMDKRVLPWMKGWKD